MKQAIMSWVKQQDKVFFVFLGMVATIIPMIRELFLMVYFSDNFSTNKFIFMLVVLTIYVTFVLWVIWKDYKAHGFKKPNK